jgi:hypothetical protein
MVARRIALAATLSLAASFASAAEQPGRTWLYLPPEASGGAARLAFAVPDTEDSLGTLICRANSRLVIVRTWGDAAPNDLPTILRAGRAASRHRSKVEPNDISEGVTIETPIAARDPVLDAFRRGATLTIRAGKAVTRLPSVDPVAAKQFFRFCG